jgi:hypothetical protein
MVLVLDYYRFQAGKHAEWSAAHPAALLFEELCNDEKFYIV